MRETKKPKISANKLGEYMSASPSRRNDIVKNQKYPKGYVVTRYNDARRAIIDYFLNGKGDSKVVECKIEDLILKTYNSSYRNQDNQLSIKALKIFSSTSIDVDLSTFSVSKFTNDLNSLVIEGVEVSVRPEVLIKGAIRGKNFVGAIKIHISKSHPLTESSGKYVATLVHKFLEEESTDIAIRPDFCLVLDIFSGQYFTAPRSFKLLRKDIKAACNEIRLLWENL